MDDTEENVDEEETKEEVDREETKDDETPQYPLQPSGSRRRRSHDDPKVERLRTKSFVRLATEFL